MAAYNVMSLCIISTDVTEYSVMKTNKLKIAYLYRQHFEIIQEKKEKESLERYRWD